MSETLTRDEVGQLIALGHVLVLHRRDIYRLNSWLSKHPGGHLALMHFVGRDASNEIEAYHSDGTLTGLMRRFVIGRVHEDDFRETKAGWKPLTPPIQLGKQGEWGRIQDYAGVSMGWKQDLAEIRAGKSNGSKPLLSWTDLEPPEPPAEIDPKRQYQLARAWEDLHEEIKQAGLYEARPLWHYRVDLLRYFTVFAGFVYVFTHSSQTWHYYLAAALLGAVWHQITFVVHDAGHVEVFGNYRADKILGSFIAAWFGGLSCLWWADNHNVHHLVTNHPEHDPDIQHIPFFAISPRFLNNLYSSYYRRTMLLDAAAKIFISVQHNLYYIVMSLARFNLFANSYQFLLMKARPGFLKNFELVGIAFFWAWFGWGVLGSIPGLGLKLGFLLTCFIVTSPLHVQITLSHFAQSTEDLGIYESFAHRQLRTTMDVDCPANLAWIHGGLNMQITHHLFPRIPRHKLPAATELVKKFASEQGLDFHIYKFVEGNGRVLSVLRDVANQVHILQKVASAQVRGELHAH